MSLRAQDILVALKLAVAPRPRSYAALSHALGMSPSQVHQAAHRAMDSGLVSRDLKPNRGALIEFLLHGVKYVFPPRRGPLARGIPTAHWVSPLREAIIDSGPPIVWPVSDGDVRGESLEPIYKSAPFAARQDHRLHQALALVDAIRAGRARERKIAGEKLKELISARPQP